MEYNFEAIERSHLSSRKVNDNELRISKKTIVFAANLLPLFVNTAKYTSTQKMRIYLAFQYDKLNNALMVTADPINGFSAYVHQDDNGAIKYITTTVPSKLRKMQPAKGNYALVDGETNVFKLV